MEKIRGIIQFNFNSRLAIAASIFLDLSIPAMVSFCSVLVLCKRRQGEKDCSFLTRQKTKANISFAIELAKTTRWQHYTQFKLKLQPDRTFWHFRASKSGERKTFCTSETWNDGLWGSEVVKGSVRTQFFEEESVQGEQLASWKTRRSEFRLPVLCFYFYLSPSPSSLCICTLADHGRISIMQRTEK